MKIYALKKERKNTSSVFLGLVIRNRHNKSELEGIKIN